MLVVGAAAIALAARGAVKPPVSLPVLGCLSASAQAWWAGLGVPLSLRLQASLASAGTLVDVGAFDGAFRAGLCAAALLCALPLMLAGSLGARVLDAANEREHAVVGVLSAVSTALLAAGLAALLPCVLSDVRAGDVEGSVRLAASPLAVGATVLAWGVLLAPAGALLRHAWRARGLDEPWAQLRPPLSGLASAGCALALAATVSTIAAAWEWKGLPLAGAGDAALAPHAVTAERIALWAAPLALNMGGTVEGRFSMTSDLTETIDVGARVTLDTGGWAATGGATGEASPPRGGDEWKWIARVVPGLLAGFVLRRLGRRSIADAAWTVFAYVLLSTLLVSWSGGWVAGRLDMPGGPAGGLGIWAAVWGGVTGVTAVALFALCVGVAIAVGGDDDEVVCPAP